MSDEELAGGRGEESEASVATKELSDDERAMARLKEAIAVEREDLGALRVKLTVTVPREIVDERMGEQFAELKRESTIPGFRKGHAPLKLVEKRFGHEVGDELKGKLVGNGYLAAIEKQDIQALGDPLVWVKTTEERVGEDKKLRSVEVDKLVPFDEALEHLELPKEGPLVFSCELELKPEFELPKLDKIPVEKPVITIGDEEVNSEIDRMLMMRGTYEPVEDGGVQSDDMLYTDMKMTVGGEIIASKENFDIAARDINVEGVRMTGLGKAVAGRKIGEVVDFEAPVPDDHDNKDLRGKTATFAFKINEIKRLTLPKLDDTFLAGLGFDSKKDLRDTVRNALESRLEGAVATRMREQIGEHLVDHTKIEIPEGLSQRQAERSVARRMVEMYQIGMPQAEIEKAVDAMRAQAHDRVVRDLKLFFILEKIAEEREIEVSEEQINGAIAQIAQRSNKRFDRVRDELSKGSGLSTLYLQIRDEKVLEALIGDADVTEVERPKTKPAPSAGKKKSDAKTTPKKSPAAAKKGSSDPTKKGAATTKKASKTKAKKKTR